MRLFFFILTALFASCASHITTNQDSSIPSTAHSDAIKGVIIEHSLPKGGGYTDFTGKNFGYGIAGTRTTYETVASNGVIIQNSLPKGNGYLDSSGERGYTDSSGKHFGYVIFWTRVTNETATPLELTINFPADSFPILSSPDSYIKVFLPPDTMTLDKESLYDYGVTGLKSFLDTGFNKPTMLQRTINPNEECLFYIAALFYRAQGVTRAGLVLKEQALFYRINLLDSALIPCGQIVLKN